VANIYLQITVLAQKNLPDDFRLPKVGTHHSAKSGKTWKLKLTNFLKRQTLSCAPVPTNIDIVLKEREKKSGNFLF
jgi:hypothetical protein